MARPISAEERIKRMETFLATTALEKNPDVMSAPDPTAALATAAAKEALRLEKLKNTRAALERSGFDFGFNPRHNSEQAVDTFIEGVRQQLVKLGGG